VALDAFERIASTSQLDPHEMRQVLGERLREHLDRLKLVMKNTGLMTFPMGTNVDRHVDEDLAKLDQHLTFQLTQFDVGFRNTKGKQMSGTVIVHGGTNNIITGDGNIAQQGTRGSQQTVNAEDIAAKLAALEQALASAQLAAADYAEIKGDIDTIKAQLAKQTPSTSIVKEAAQSIQRVVEGAVGNALGNPVCQAAQALAQMLGLS
jgi:hypothetical protein